MIEKIELNNFTVFSKLDMSFSPGINVLIGKNGTGKTHVLKIIYSVLSALAEKKRISDKIRGVFLPKDQNIGRLTRRTRGSSKTKVVIFKKGKPIRLLFSNHTKDTLRMKNEWEPKSTDVSVFIPAKEMLSNAPGFLSLYKERQIHFEEIYSDIISRAFTPPLRGPIARDRKNLLNQIQKAIEGKVIFKNELFFLKNKSGDLEFTLLAEGMRKLGLLWLLIQNGTLLKGTKLFWDEPEANLNPTLIGVVADVLLSLQRMGVQIFIATHDYVTLKELDLRKKDSDEILYHSLYSSNGEIKWNSTSDYFQIDPNAISEAFSGLYNRDIEKALK